LVLWGEAERRGIGDRGRGYSEWGGYESISKGKEAETGAATRKKEEKELA